jgi:nitric oxide reductase subunit B
VPERISEGEFRGKNRGALAVSNYSRSYVDMYIHMSFFVVWTTAPAEAFEANAAHYTDVFANGRAEYAIPKGALTDPQRQQALNAFFFWTAWACGANRPDLTISYTQNWPHEPLIDNKPTTDAVVWSILSFVLLLAGIGAMIWYFASLPRHGEDETEAPHHDPLLGYRPTPSQKATLKYFYVAAALLLLQIGLGAVTAHYGVEGAGFYGIPLDRLLPYAVTRTWHTQLGIFWIATTWLAKHRLDAHGRSQSLARWPDADVGGCWRGHLVRSQR